MGLRFFIRGIFGLPEPHEDVALNLHPLIGRTARYGFIGALCALANNAVMILGDLAGAHYLPMTLLSFAIVVPFGYLLHSTFTFSTERSIAGLLCFASGRALGIPLSILAMTILCTGLGLQVAIAAPIATVILFLWNYASAHWAIIGRLRFGGDQTRERLNDNFDRL